MYGFHKVSDVFHTGSPDSPVWEFKHGNASFKRGHLVGLREIKKKTSRHALVPHGAYAVMKQPLSKTNYDERAEISLRYQVEALENEVRRISEKFEDEQDKVKKLEERARLMRRTSHDSFRQRYAEKVIEVEALQKEQEGKDEWI
jgi:hypothetical protein